MKFVPNLNTCNLLRQKNRCCMDKIYLTILYYRLVAYHVCMKQLQVNSSQWQNFKTLTLLNLFVVFHYCYIPTTVIPIPLIDSSNWISRSLNLASVSDLYSMKRTGMAYGLRFRSSSAIIKHEKMGCRRSLLRVQILYVFQ